VVTVTRGDIVLCDLNPVVGTEQAGVRPVVILQNDRANAVSPHSVLVCEQIRVVDKRRIVRVLGHLDDSQMEAIEKAISEILSM
jgi:mRNA interferase MazF